MAPAISELGHYQIVEARGQVEVVALLYGDSVRQLCASLGCWAKLRETARSITSVPKGRPATG